MVHSRRVTVARAWPRASSSRAKASMSARRTENSGSERARHQPANCRRSRVYASRVRPRYPARNPASASRSASVNAGWCTREEEWDGGAIGAPPGTAGTREAGPHHARHVLVLGHAAHLSLEVGTHLLGAIARGNPPT